MYKVSSRNYGHSLDTTQLRELDSLKYLSYSNCRWKSESQTYYALRWTLFSNVHTLLPFNPIPASESLHTNRELFYTFLQARPIQCRDTPREPGSLRYPGISPIHLPLCLKIALHITCNSASRVLAVQHALNYGVRRHLIPFRRQTMPTTLLSSAQGKGIVVSSVIFRFYSGKAEKIRGG